MDQATKLSPQEIRALREEHPKLRDRDFADKFDISEAELAASFCGQGTTRIESHPDKVIEAVQSFGEVMALTRNLSCVNEKIGTYDNYRSGAHAAMVLTPEIDLRIFPAHWRNAFMIEKETDHGLRRSLHVFDAAGDAIHKIHMRDTSDEAGWNKAKTALALEDQGQTLITEPRKPAEAPKSDLAKKDILEKEWRRMTDTHQFMRLTSKLKMNRLGAYRIVGPEFVRPLETGAVDQMLQQIQAKGIEVMIFVGNRGCIQIHSGPVETLRAMGPWQNVMDPRFNLHLRLDHIAEVWAVEKPTQRGPAVSVEAFDAQGSVILQVFGIGAEGRDSRPAWKEIVASLNSLKLESA